MALGGAALLAGVVAPTAHAFATARPAIRTTVARSTGPSPTSPDWCLANGAALAGWAATTPALPLCGPGPAYGGSWTWIDIPGPSGALSPAYFNATPGFQCVELAERYLSVAYGLAPVKANGSDLALAYHAAYPATALVVNGSSKARGSPPVSGDVVSFSMVPGFEDPGDGHVAVVVSSKVDASTGDGTVTIAQENVGADQMVRTIDLVAWRLVDPSEPPNAEWQYPFAEWLHVPVHRLDLRAFVGAHTRVAPRPALQPLSLPASYQSGPGR